MKKLLESIEKLWRNGKRSESHYSSLKADEEGALTS